MLMLCLDIPYSILLHACNQPPTSSPEGFQSSLPACHVYLHFAGLLKTVCSGET